MLSNKANCRTYIEEHKTGVQTPEVSWTTKEKDQNVWSCPVLFWKGIIHGECDRTTPTPPQQIPSPPKAQLLTRGSWTNRRKGWRWREERHSRHSSTGQRCPWWGQRGEQQPQQGRLPHILVLKEIMGAFKTLLQVTWFQQTRLSNFILAWNVWKFLWFTTRGCWSQGEWMNLYQVITMSRLCRFMKL